MAATARFCVAMVLCVWAAALLPARAAPAGPWHITKTEWSAADEKGFGDFVRKIAESGCTTSVECMRGPGNPYRASDPAAQMRAVAAALSDADMEAVAQYVAALPRLEAGAPPSSFATR